MFTSMVTLGAQMASTKVQRQQINKRRDKPNAGENKREQKRFVEEEEEEGRSWI